MDILLNIFAEVLKIDISSLNDESSPDNTEKWDSLNAMKLVVAIEEAFNIELSTSEIMGMRSIGIVRKVLNKKGVGI